MIDMKKMQRTDIDLIEDALVPYLLCTAMKGLQKEGGWQSMNGWTDLLNNASGAVMNGLGSGRVRRLCSTVAAVTKDTYKAASPAQTYLHMVAGVAFLITGLVKDWKFTHTQNQGVLISTMLLHEISTADFKVDIKIAKAAANNMRNKLHSMGYFL